jgi:hypothetical protein
MSAPAKLTPPAVPLPLALRWSSDRLAGVGVMVGMRVGVSVGVGVKVGVDVAVGVSVGVGISVGKAVAVGVGAGVAVAGVAGTSAMHDSLLQPLVCRS